MPRATGNIADTQRFELKTCPEGYVILRRHLFGESLQRRQMAVDMRMEQGEGNKALTQIGMNSTDVTLFDFATQIVEHNLEDESGRALNFKTQFDVSLLSAPVGEEIVNLLEEINNWKREN